MKSHDQVERLLLLVPYLQAHDGATVPDVASRFEVSPEQLLKDLKVLWMCGLPGGLPGDLIDIDMDAAEGEGVIHLSNADYLSRPMRFTPDEAMSLLVALQAVAEVATGEQAAAVASAVGKLRVLAGDVAADQVAIRVSSGWAPLREQLAGAIAAGRRVQLTYDGLTRGVTTRPLVDPVSIVMRDGTAYLRAWSVERDDWRTYRLDRIDGVDVTDEAAGGHGEPPPMGQTWFDGGADAVPSVTLRLSPGAAWITEYYPTTSVTTDGDDTVAVLPVADPAWLTGRLLRLGAGAVVVEPAGAGADAAERAREALAGYDAWQLG